MPAKWVSSSVLDNGLNHIKNNATRMLLIKNYTSGDSYATVTSGTNVIATVVMTSADYSLGDGASGSRTLTTAASKSEPAVIDVAAGNDLHFAFTDGTANVIWVTDETTNQPITSGNTVNFPQLVYTSNQPT